MMPTGRAGDRDTSQGVMWTDHVSLIETRSANFIRASGHMPRQQAGHMTAPDRDGNQVKFFLQRRGRPHMTPWSMAEDIPHKAGCEGQQRFSVIMARFVCGIIIG